jgi:hypothetical protein
VSSVRESVCVRVLCRHENTQALAHLRITDKIDTLDVTVEKCARADLVFWRQTREQWMQTMYASVAHANHATNSRYTYDATLATMLLLFVEVLYLLIESIQQTHYSVWLLRRSTRRSVTISVCITITRSTTVRHITSVQRRTSRSTARAVCALHALCASIVRRAST